MLRIITFLLIFSSLAAKAAPGDTTWVTVHNNTQMTWYERYSAKALLPDGSKEYHKILMYYTMGCANNGCSDWDYTTRVELLEPTGVMDSNIASIDTISTSPLQIDTTWNSFEVKEHYELARVITPYGGSLPNSWQHDFVYDVTDYYPLLQDSVEMEIFYQGWSAGFSGTVKFAFIEGTRPRDVVRIDNVYMGGGNYLNSNDFETDHLPAKTIALDPAAAGLDLRVNFSGHGFVNALNCAEFCKKDYYVKVGGQQVASQAMWRDDCGLNPVWPQAGTWLYDRANWCPGDKSLFRSHDLSSHISGSSIDLDVDIEAYSYTVPSGEVPASYNYSVQLIQYATPNHQNDVELERIITPSDADEAGRFNPVCGTARVKIRNKGAQPLNSCTIKYGLKGQAWHSYQWSGNLGHMKSATVELPFGSSQQDWWSGSNKLQFEASAFDPNGVMDENPLNNQSFTSYEAAPVYPGKLQFYLKTNNAASETHWTLKNLADSTIASGDNLQNNNTYTHNFDLAPGCYILSIKDRDKDGLSFFGNNDGGGIIRLLNNGGPTFFKSLNSNFGTELRKEFTVGYGIGNSEVNSKVSLFEMYPNPTKDHINLHLVSAQNGDVKLELTDLSGKTILERSWIHASEVQEQLDLKSLAPGTYLVRLQFDNESHHRKIIVR